VLVVDDDEALRTLFLTLITRNGFRVECVNDGTQALARLARHSYAVILLDLMMPQTNGYDVLRELARTKPHLLRRTIVTTGVSERDLAKIDEKSVFAVLRKPFDINQLIATISDCARRSNGEHDGTRGGHDEARLDDSIRQFESALPELRTLLATPACDGELILRSQLRRAVGELAGVIFAASSIPRDARRRERYQQLSRSASSISLARALSSRHEH
jgi:CheY-like chemotaxis protein